MIFTYLFRASCSSDSFIDVYVNSSLETCEKRDVKGLYAKARNGEIKNFTGVSSPYEVPNCSDIEVNTEKESLDVCLEKLMDNISKKI